MIRVLPFVLVLFIAAAFAEQGTTSSGLRPAHEPGAGPVVAFDEAHKNTHTFGSRNFQGFVELLQREGYRPRALTLTITPRSLKDVDVLVVSGPGGWEGPEASLTAIELKALVEWVRSGRSLLLIVDHMPAPRNGATVAAALGVPEWHNGFAMVDVDGSLPVGNIIFWRSKLFPAGESSIGSTGPGGGTGYQGPDAVLADHVITEGRSSSERVRSVATFVGSAFKPPPRADVLLTMPRRAVSLVPKGTGRTDVRVDAQRTAVGEWVQGVVLPYGNGRVAIFGESGLFSGGPAADNRQFILNVMHWLSRVL